MQTLITPAEHALLKAWAALDGSPDRSLARRARCLLNDSSQPQQFLPHGLNESRVLEIQAVFEQMGVLALVDAPRSGRPPNPVPGARGDAPARGGAVAANQAVSDNRRQSRDTAWRLGRVAGLSVERSRHVTAIHVPPSSADGALAAVYVGYGIWLAATRSGKKPQVGVWHHPQRLARDDATRAELPGGPRQPFTDLNAALTSHLKTPGPARPRAESEKIVYWCAGVARMARAGPVSICLCAQPDTPLLRPILKGFRRYSLWQGKGGRLHTFALVDVQTWQAGIRRNLGPTAPLLLDVEAAAFAWCC